MQHKRRHITHTLTFTCTRIIQKKKKLWRTNKWADHPLRRTAAPVAAGCRILKSPKGIDAWCARECWKQIYTSGISHATFWSLGMGNHRAATFYPADLPKLIYKTHLSRSKRDFEIVFQQTAKDMARVSFFAPVIEKGICSGCFVYTFFARRTYIRHALSPHLLFYSYLRPSFSEVSK